MPDQQHSGPIRAIIGMLWRFMRWIGRVVRGQVVKRTGGPARARVITLFACVLALNGADSSTVGAIAPQLEAALHINNTDLGLLSSVSLLVTRWGWGSRFATAAASEPDARDGRAL